MISLPRVVSLSLCLSIALLSSACQNDEKEKTTELKIEETKTSLRSVARFTGENVVKKIYLRNRLNESSIAYVRIPNIWSFLGAPKGNVFDAVEGSQPYVEVVESIRDGFIKNVIPDFSHETKIFASILTQSINSPIELAVFKENANAGISQSSLPHILLTSSMDFDSHVDVQELLHELKVLSPLIEITQAVNADGYGEIAIAGINGQVFWEQTQSRLFILAGVNLSPNMINDTVKALALNNEHKMLTVEKTIDESGQGIFLWTDPSYISDLAGAFGMHDALLPLTAMGVGSMNSIAAGAGTSNGANRLKLVLDMPATGFRSFTPIIKSNPTFNITGNASTVAVLGLPNKSTFNKLEGMATFSAAPESVKAYRDAKQIFAQKAGFNVEDIFDIFGQDISLVSGEAGTYIALRLNNEAAFKQALETSVKEFKLSYEQRNINGHTFHHLKVPIISSESLDALNSKNNDDETSKLFKRLTSTPSHLYWEQEGDYLIFAGIPQVLIDRHYIDTVLPANEWLEKQQRIDSTGSLLMLSMKNQGNAESIYRFKLNLLSFLGDFVGKPVDLFSLPSPLEAKLPESGAASIKITSSETQLAFELVYENSPLELLSLGNNLQGVAVIGILAAVALPAYSDYTIRAKLAEGISEARRVTTVLDAFSAKNQRYPNQEEISKLNTDKSKVNYDVFVEENTGHVIVIFNDNLFNEPEKTLIIKPKKDNPTHWKCTSQILPKYLPQSCRNQYQ